MGPQTQVDPAHDGTLHPMGPHTKGPHTMGPCTQWDPAHDGTPHNGTPHDGTPHTMGPRTWWDPTQWDPTRWDPTHDGTPHTMGPYNGNCAHSFVVILLCWYRSNIFMVYVLTQYFSHFHWLGIYRICTYLLLGVSCCYYCKWHDIWVKLKGCKHRFLPLIAILSCYL